MYHNYYQWVCLLLVLQACICYVPWALWKQTERGRVGKLVANLSKDPLTEVPLTDQVAGLATFLASHTRARSALHSSGSTSFPDSSIPSTHS